MCHQTVGLIQGRIEKAGIPCVSVTLRPEITIHTRVSRSVYLRFPMGRPIGEPHQVDAQRMVVKALLSVLASATEPETHLEAPFRWRRVKA